VKVGGMLRETVAASAAIAASTILLAGLAGHLAVGIGLGAGLMIGAFNGHLVAGLLHREAPFLAASMARLAFVSAVAILVALMLGSAAWAVLLGVAAAQAVMVAAAVRQGLRA
jgi:hypothetical protein